MLIVNNTINIHIPLTFTVNLLKEEQNQTIPHQSAPQVWHVMYVDRYTCQDGETDAALEDLRFQITLMNPDTAGNPLDHFSAEETGQTHKHTPYVSLHH